MNLSNPHDVRIYQINSNFYEFGNTSTPDHKIAHIIEFHKSKLESPFDDNSELTTQQVDEVEYTLYSYDAIEKESTWKKFLPIELLGENDFLVKTPSFILFMVIGNHIFVTIGGRASGIIQKFINHNFGFDLYEKIANPVEDIVQSITTRGLTGNLASDTRTFRNEQRLEDSLSLGQIPKKIVLTLRKELIDTLFFFVSFDESESINLEIGNSFCIKWKISFEETHELIKCIHETLKCENSTSLSRFDRIKDENFIAEKLEPSLHEYLHIEYTKLTSPSAIVLKNLDYDFVHPQKLTAFHEADNYQVFLKGGRTPILETIDRKTILESTFNYIYNELNPEDQFEFIGILMGIRVESFTKNVNRTKAPFITHITCEISFLNEPYFYIDKTWYQVKGDFINEINNQCLSLLNSNLLKPNPLNEIWEVDNLSEGEYNLLYQTRDNYIVMDKIISQNIELCDILYETENITYLIHVKAGFDAKIRDLTNQITVSANRLWNDLKADKSFIKTAFNKYEVSNNYKNDLTLDDFEKKFDKDIVFVLAYCPKKSQSSVLSDIKKFKSNIAKFSIIQTMRDMKTNLYPLRIIEISNKNG